MISNEAYPIRLSAVVMTYACIGICYHIFHHGKVPDKTRHRTTPTCSDYIYGVEETDDHNVRMLWKKTYRVKNDNVKNVQQKLLCRWFTLVNS